MRSRWWPAMGLGVLGGCIATVHGTAHTAIPEPGATPSAEAWLIVDCLLPGQVRKLGTRVTYVSPRRPVRTSAHDCEIRGGEYVAYDRADYRTALSVWLPAAEAGDLQAQTYVGLIHERGLGLAPDFQAAASWYQRAGAGGSGQALVNLAHLYERGLGVPADPVRAQELYRQASGLTAVDLDQPGDVALAQAQVHELAALQEDLERLQEERSRLEAALADQEAVIRRQEDTERAAAAAERERLAAELADLHRLSETQADRITALEAERQHLEQVSRDSERAASAGLLAGPRIALVEPAVAGRGQTVVAVRSAEEPGAVRRLVGRVEAPAGLLTLLVNGEPVLPGDDGLFETAVPLGALPRNVQVVAVDRQGKHASMEFAFAVPDVAAPDLAVPDAPAAPEPAPLAGIEFGNYYALVIGNNAYQHLPRLKTAATDATVVAQVLEERYGYRTELLLNATRYEMLSALNRYRENLTSSDNLLVYYAGHGEIDRVNMRGHWLPVDAEPNNDANWISNVSVTDILNVMASRQVLLIVDSCYAGTLTRSAAAALPTAMTDSERLLWLTKMTERRARLVLTSGGLAPVLDEGGGEHSVFARSLLEVLRHSDDLLDGRRLHQEVAARVAYAASRMKFEQVPEYSPIRFAGHEMGEFFFVPPGLLSRR
jgi:uncharacterized caspase-like protein